MYKKILCLLAASTTAIVLGGCMVGEVRHTIYIEPDGSLEWVASQRYFRSAEDKPEERRKEELEFRQAALSESHPIAEGLRLLGPELLWSDWIRESRPFHLETHATFRSIGAPIEAFLREAGIVGDVEVVRSGDEVSLTITIDVAATEAAHSDDADDSPVLALVTDSDSDGGYRFVLTQGEFLDGRGFVLSGDEADFDYDVLEWDENSSEPLVLSLSWTTEPPGA